MGLIKAALSSLNSTLADQYKEYIYCEALPTNVLVRKGQKQKTRRGSNNGSDNIITNGSGVAVADGQCLLIVENGKIIDVCAEPGEYKYDSQTSPSILSGSLNKDSILGVLKDGLSRVTYGGETGKDQRVYYVNTKEITGNKYGTPSPVPFRVVDTNINLDMDISIRCFGEYSYRITNPLLFYTNVCGNVTKDYTRDQIDSMLKTELLTALQPAFARISEMGIRYSALPGHAQDMADTLNEVLSAKWRDLRGLEIVSCGVSSVTANAEDEKMIKELQRNATFRDPRMAAAQLVGAQSSAMQDAAKNSNGAMTGFMGMNMAQTAGGVNAQSLFAMADQQAAAQQAAPAPAPAADTWTCPSCGTTAKGKFCPECGAKKPAPMIQAGWTCPSCGTVNTGRFCQECGSKKPAGAKQYRCDKCGWTPEDPANPPRFCPECGDPFGDEDVVG